MLRTTTWRTRERLIGENIPRCAASRSHCCAMARDTIPGNGGHATVVELPLPPRSAQRGSEGPVATPVAAVLPVLAIAQAALFGVSYLFHGYYAFSQWGLVALVSCAMLVATLLVRPLRLSRPAGMVLGGIVGLVAWAALSATWAESAENAWREVARFGLYAVTIALTLNVVQGAQSARRVLNVLTLMSGTFVVYVLARLISGGAGTMFVEHRLHEPLGYVNGQAGLLLIAFWLLFACGERASRRLVAGGALALAAGAAQLLVLTQSRAVLPALASSLLLVMTLLRGRLRRGLALLLTFAGVAVALPALLVVVDQNAEDLAARPTESVLRTAGVISLLAACAVGAAWAAALWARERRPPTPRTRRSVAAALVAILLAMLAFVGLTRDPIGHAETAISAFKAQSRAPTGSSRFISGGGYRYDLWRVAFDDFKHDPLRGVGAGNYPTSFLLHRRSPQVVRQPHSLEFQVLGELGVPGISFLLLFLGGAAAVLWSSRRGIDLRLAIAGVGVVTAWTVHTSVDWLHNVPGLSGIALLCLALLASVPREVCAQAPTSAKLTHRGRAGLIAALCALALLAASIGRLYAAETYRRDATSVVARDPAAALRSADRAISIDGDLMDAYYVKAAALARGGDYEGARATLLTAADREPHNFVPFALLGDLATRRGDIHTARRHYRQAERLNPYDTQVETPAAPAETP
jgi:O-antigen ligase